MPVTKEDLKLLSNSIKILSMDGVQKANSGHPGMPLGTSDIVAVLWSKFLKFNPQDPKWINRDRFVLSAGHASMLLYSLLHLSGYDLTIDDLKNFRQLNSKTPGHPEHHMTPGVEATTGPLGQGFANGVGMGVASNIMQQEFSSDIIDHYVYALVSDGDIMEGISAEAASLAGHMGLGNLIYIYDSNRITIEGSTDVAFTENVGKRFEAYNWHVQEIDGHDFDAIESAIINAQKETGKPSIIVANTIIAKGSVNKEGSHKVHGSPLGPDEIIATKKSLGCSGEDFCIDNKAYEIMAEIKAANKGLYDKWTATFNKKVTGDQKTKWDQFFSEVDIDALRPKLVDFKPGESIATRSASGKVIEGLYPILPNFMGGSADLSPSNMTHVNGYNESGKGKVGRVMHYGIREHAMGAIQNGIAYYGGLINFSATFLVFMDYMRPAMRIAALGELHAIYVLTHDSFFVGEDGPTHQPIETVASARAIPNLNVIRPADPNETREAWLSALKNSDKPTAFALTRQNVPVLESNAGTDAKDLHKGAYITYECDGEPDIILLASGSEVHISVEAAKELAGKGIKARVVSFPCWELFDEQPEEYRKKILSHGTPKAVIEAGIQMGWEKYAGNHALFITMKSFGASGPANILAEHFGFTTANIVGKVTEHLKK